MASFFVEESDYQQTSGIEFEYVRSGYLNVQPTNDQASEPVSVPFVWYWPGYTYFRSRRSNYFSYFWFWDQNVLPEEKSAFESELNNLHFVKFELNEDPEEFYYLVLPKQDENPFLDIDGIDLELDGYDPTYEDGLFPEILNSSYEFVSVEEAELDMADLLDFVALENQEPILIPPSQPSDNVGGSTSIPEPSSLGGISVVAVLLLVVMVKRGWSQVWQYLRR